MKNIFLFLTCLTFIGCQKESMYKYAYQLSSAPKKTMVFEKVPFIATNFVMKNQANLEMLNKQTLERWNSPQQEKVYKIDTSWIEEVKCMGCKNW